MHYAKYKIMNDILLVRTIKGVVIMKKIKSLLLASVLLVLICVLTACVGQSTGNEAISPNPIPAQNTVATGIMEVHFIDVGQGDSTLIQLTDGKNILIDGGNRGDAAVIAKYLQDQQVSTIDYLIATHPHEDHIGSLPAIIRSFDIGSIYMPKVTANTKIFEDLLLSIKEKGHKINTAAAGVKIIDTKDLKLTIIAPNMSEYDELNNYSAVVRLSYMNTSFLFTGDAEDVSEKEILNKYPDIKSDVIKIGHHGGRTSSTMEFLKNVAPSYAVISLGKDNDYGHPHKETLERLEAMNMQIYRTDLMGSIVASTDGNTITVNKTPIKSSTNNTIMQNVFIGNKNSKIYHINICSGLPKLENQIKLASKTEAENKGYQPCKICKP